MTATSGTSLVLSVLSLVVSLVVGVGAVLMARANLQRQIQVTTRQAWMRDFREQSAQCLAWQRALALRQMNQSPTAGSEREENARQTEIQDGVLRSFHTMRLLVAESGEEHVEFMQNLQQIVSAPNPEEREARVQAFAQGAETILRKERAAIEASSWMWR